MHVPASLYCDSSDKLVIFIHGFMGSPDQFSDLADAVYHSGHSCISILLPGHGVCASEFVKFGVDDWERHIENEICKVRQMYNKIYLVGHSMGGLIALNASLARKNKVAGVFLISTPLKLNLWRLKPFLFRLRFLLYPKNHEIKSAYLKANSISKSNILSYPFFIKPLIHFYKLVRKTKKQLNRVFARVYMIHSTNDETTSYKSSRLLYDGLSGTQKNAYTIHQSRHVFYTAQEREIICEKLLDFIK